jgi:hypothetical protein
MITPQAQAILKLQQLPAPLVQEVSDFIDFIWVRQDQKRWQQWHLFCDGLEWVEADFASYLTQLETYEERLARGEIQW